MNRRELRQHAIGWLKNDGRPLLNRVLARYSRIGDPVVFDPQAFPWVDDLEADWKKIRAEAERVLELREHIPAFQEISPDQYRISDNDQWKTFWYCGFGHRSEVFEKSCPETARLIDAVPEVETAFFSILAPGKHIPAHRGVAKAIINCHLGLIVPEQTDRCRMRVGTETFGWEEGRVRIFDDTNEHEVWNDTDQDRIVLMLQFRRPLREPGRLLARIFLSVLRLTPYVRVAVRNQALFDRRFEAAVHLRAEAEAGG